MSIKLAHSIKKAAQSGKVVEISRNDPPDVSVMINPISRHETAVKLCFSVVETFDS